MDSARELQRHLPLVLLAITIIAILLAACLYYCSAYHKVQAKLIEANVWRRVSINLEKEGVWRTSAWREEENLGGLHGTWRERGDGRDEEARPRTYVRDTVARRTSEKMRKISGHASGNPGSRALHHEMIEMKEIKKTVELKKPEEKFPQPKQQGEKFLGDRHLALSEISKRPRMPLPTEIDSLYSLPKPMPKSVLSSTDFGERFIYDVVEVPEFISRYKTPTGGAQDKMLYEKMDLGGNKKYNKIPTASVPKEEFSEIIC